jgi:glutaminyl-peptide cyclotransferase
LCPWCDTLVTLTATISPVKLLATVAAGAVLAVAMLVAACDSSSAGGGNGASANLKVDRFDSAAAWRRLVYQVKLGPRPAGSEQSLRLARRLRRLLPRGHFEPVPGGLRNVVGTVRGREPGYVVVGAHYDTKDIPGFVGANDGASGTAVLTQLARTIRRPRHTIKFILFDGEESPRGSTDFFRDGLRGSKVAARRYRDARAMVLLDYVGEKGLRIPREASSNEELWERLRRAARRVGAGVVFPDDTQASVGDDHVPFIQQGIPAIDLIDFDFDCFHRPCDNLSVVSEGSLDAVGETMVNLLARL